jgi:hypothetical protein
MALNVVGRQEWRGFCRFGCRKNFDAWRCTRSRAVDTVQIVKCGLSNAGAMGAEPLAMRLQEAPPRMTISIFFDH